jgi:hypothetical protein
VTLLDELVPAWDFDERHGIRADASAERLLAAVREVTPAEAPLLRTLYLLRGISTTGEEPLLEQMVRAGFRVLGDREDELVAGAIGRPWRVWERIYRDAEFATFDEPGWLKMALGFRARHGELVTETRVLATSDEARRRFRPYWLAVRPASGLTRRSWLAAARDRAEGRTTTV